MKYKCLVLDHDDTAVDSTATVHYPAHVEMMKRFRPNDTVVSLENWFRKNFDPGIVAFLTEELAFSKKEMEEEFRIWQEFNEQQNPPFYPGLNAVLVDYLAAGGLLAVVSHSTEDHIRRHYSHGAPGVKPRFIFGWDHDPKKRKPSPWPLERIMEETGFGPGDLLMVDDLKPGVDMAKAVGVRTAAAGWGHSIPEIEEGMREICDFWLPNIKALRSQLFE